MCGNLGSIQLKWVGLSFSLFRAYSLITDSVSSAPISLSARSLDVESQQYSGALLHLPARHTSRQTKSEALHLLGNSAEDGTSLSLSAPKVLQGSEQQQDDEVPEILSRGVTQLVDKLGGGMRGVTENFMQDQPLAGFRASDAHAGSSSAHTLRGWVELARPSRDPGGLLQEKRGKQRSRNNVLTRSSYLKGREPDRSSPEWHQWKSKMDATMATTAPPKARRPDGFVGLTPHDLLDFHSGNSNRISLLRDRLTTRIQEERARQREKQDEALWKPQLHADLTWRAATNLLATIPSKILAAHLPGVLLATAHLPLDEAAGKQILQLLAHELETAKVATASVEGAPHALPRPASEALQGTSRRRLTKKQLALQASIWATPKDKTEFGSSNNSIAYKAWDRVQLRERKPAKMSPLQREAMMAKLRRKQTAPVPSSTVEVQKKRRARRDPVHATPRSAPRIATPRSAVEVEQASKDALFASGYPAPSWLPQTPARSKVNAKAAPLGSPQHSVPPSPTGSDSSLLSELNRILDQDQSASPHDRASSPERLRSPSSASDRMAISAQPIPPPRNASSGSSIGYDASIFEDLPALVKLR